MEQFLNFNEVTPVSASNYFSPGQYTVTPTEVKFVEVGDQKTKALSITFESEDGRKLEEKFYVQGKTLESTKKHLGRLQYLHYCLYGMEVKAEFSSYEQFTQYFHDALLKKTHKINMIIGGKTKNGTTYSSLPFGGFVYEGENFEEKEYPKDSDEYKKVVSVEKTTPAPATAAPVLNAPSMTNGTAKLPWQK